MSRRNPVNSFKEAVEATLDVATGYKPGITALGSYSKKIEAKNPKLLQGSVDIDECTKQKYPNANRWDYAFGHNNQIYFVEVHSANSREVQTVINKLNWLKEWLSNQAPEINKLITKNASSFYWIQSGSFAIPRTSKQYRMARKYGILPISILKI